MCPEYLRNKKKTRLTEVEQTKEKVKRETFRQGV